MVVVPVQSELDSLVLEVLDRKLEGCLVVVGHWVEFQWSYICGELVLSGRHSRLFPDQEDRGAWRVCIRQSPR